MLIPSRSLAAFAVALTLALTLLPIAAPAQAAPSKADSELAGAVLYRDKGCAFCHGSALEGTTHGPSVEKIGKRWKVPQIVDQIENGGQKMPSFKDSLSDAEVAQLVAYLRAKHRPTPPPPPPPAAASTPNPGQ